MTICVGLGEQFTFFLPRKFIEKLSGQSVGYFHIAGFTPTEGYLIDSHEENVSLPVRDLANFAFKTFGKHPIVLERDNWSATKEELLAELCRLREG